MSISAAALVRISEKHARYMVTLEARVKALELRCDAAYDIPIRQARLAAMAQIEREAAKLQERARRHQQRTGRWLMRVLGELELLPIQRH